VGASADVPGSGNPAGGQGLEGSEETPPSPRWNSAVEGGEVFRPVRGRQAGGGLVGEWAGLPEALLAKGVGGPTCALSRLRLRRYAPAAQRLKREPLGGTN